MLITFKTKDEYQEWLNGTPLKSGVVAYIEEDNTAYFSTNNIDGNFETLECGGIGGENFVGMIDKTISGDVVIPYGMTKIRDYAFRYCLNVTSITIPDSVTSIGLNAFQSCRGLTSISIPDSVTSIIISAFDGCSNLKEVSISEGITSIGQYAFRNCDNLLSVVIKATTPPSVMTSTFPKNTSNLKIYVPSESVDAYKTATNWGGWASKIYPIE